MLTILFSAKAQIGALIDSLQYELDHAEGDTLKIDLLGELSYEYAIIDTDTAILYAEEGLQLAKSIGDGKRTVSMINYLGVGYYMKSDYMTAIEKYKEAIELDKQQNGSYYPRGLNNLSMSYRSLGKYDLAADAIYKALEYNEKHGLLKSKMSNYNNLGALFRLSSEYEKALQGYYEARKIAFQLNDSSFLEYIYHNTGVVFSKMEEHKRAIDYYDSALKISVGLGHDPKHIFSSLGYDYVAIGNYTDGRKYLQLALQSSIKSKDKNLKSVILNNLGNLAITTEEYDQAIDHGLESLELSEDIKNAERKRIALKVLHEAYSGIGNFELAHNLLVQLRSHEDSLFALDKLKAISELETKYETAEKEKQIANLALAKTNAETRRNIYLIALIGVVCFSALVVFWLRYRIRKNKELKEKEILRYESELNIYTNRLVEKSSRIEELNQELEKVKEEISGGCPTYNGALDHLMQSTILTADEWMEFKKLFNQVHTGFLSNVRIKYPDLTETEERLMALTKLNLNNKEIASMLGISLESVNKSRYRLRKKLNIPSGEMESIVAEL